MNENENDQSNLARQALERAEAGERIEEKEALALWRFGGIHEMGRVAHLLRRQKTDPGKVSYTVFQIINYTDICNIDCTFCSFQHKPDSGQGYVLTAEQILDKAKSAREKDCRQLFIQGGVNPGISFDYYLDILQRLKEYDPSLHIRGFSPVEVLAMSRQTGKSLSGVLLELKDAGLDSFPGAGAEILTQRMRNELSQKKAMPIEWFEAMKEAFLTGMKGSANIVWGSVETDREIIAHLALVRQLQDETGGLLSFVPWTFQRQTKRFKVRHVPAHEYLRMLALCRIFLDNVPNIEVSLLAKGTDVGEIALFYGANDINSPVLEENVLRSYGLNSEKECIDFITRAGFEPVRRNFLFEMDKKS